MSTAGAIAFHNFVIAEDTGIILFGDVSLLLRSCFASSLNQLFPYNGVALLIPGNIESSLLLLVVFFLLLLLLSGETSEATTTTVSLDAALSVPIKRFATDDSGSSRSSRTLPLAASVVMIAVHVQFDDTVNTGFMRDDGIGNPRSRAGPLLAEKVWRACAPAEICLQNEFCYDSDPGCKIGMVTKCGIL